MKPQERGGIAVQPIPAYRAITCATRCGPRPQTPSPRHVTSPISQRRRRGGDSRTGALQRDVRTLLYLCANI